MVYFKLTTFHKCVLTFIVALTFQAAYAQVYKNVDKSGNVTFSDQPSPDSVPVDVNDINISDRPEMAGPRLQPNSENEGLETPNRAYQNLVITTPEDGTIIPNGLVPLKVLASISPRLRKSHALQLLVDGKVFSEGKSSSFTLPSVNRGTHTLQLKVVDINKKIVQRSPTSTIFAYRPGGK